MTQKCSWCTLPHIFFHYFLILVKLIIQICISSVLTSDSNQTSSLQTCLSWIFSSTPNLTFFISLFHYLLISVKSIMQICISWVPTSVFNPTFTIWSLIDVSTLLHARLRLIFTVYFILYWSHSRLSCNKSQEQFSRRFQCNFLHKLILVGIIILHEHQQFLFHHLLIPFHVCLSDRGQLGKIPTRASQYVCQMPTLFDQGNAEANYENMEIAAGFQ